MEQNYKLTILDFWGENCLPCKKVAPIIDQLESEYYQTVEVKKINVELKENEDLLIKYKVRSIPTVIFLKEDKIVDTYVGPHPKSIYEQLIKKHLC